MGSLIGPSYLLPRVALDMLHSARAWSRFPQQRSLLSPNRAFGDTQRGSEVHILGNGPSLNNFDLARIYGRPVITMNHFELHPARDKFDIVAHCIGEPFGTPTWEEPRPMLEGVQARKFWFHASAVGYFGGTPDHVCYYAPGIQHTAPWYRHIDLTKPSLSYQSTSQMAIALAIFMGFRTINLVGFDHDWLVTRGHSPHFYEEREEIDKADLSAFSYLEMIEISRTLFRTYVKLKQLAASADCRIYNLSTPSYLDVFPTTKIAS